MRAGVCKKENTPNFQQILKDEQMEQTGTLEPLTFDGRESKHVMPGEFFWTDPLELDLAEGDSICLEITFKGGKMPCHPESLIPSYIKRAGKWALSKEIPCPGMIGCDRTVKARIAYLGDSITQGIGVGFNSYDHWSAKLSRKLGSEYAFWNLGLGFGSANDAASDGAWLFKAKQNDIVVLCYGVNDILRGFSEKQIKNDLQGIVERLQHAGVKVLLQTIPPFDYEGENILKWRRVNHFIKEELCRKAEMVFDVVPILGGEDAFDCCAKYGGHPNVQGSTAWAQALYPQLKGFIEEILPAMGKNI